MSGVRNIARHLGAGCTGCGTRPLIISSGQYIKLKSLEGVVIGCKYWQKNTHAGDFEDFPDIVLQAAEHDPAVDAFVGVDGF